MRKSSVFLATLLLLGGLLALTGPAQADLSKLDIVAIKSINITSSGTNYMAEIVALVSNKGDQNLKLKDVNFNVKFQGQDNVLDFGNAKVDELVVPKASDPQNPTTVDLKLKVKVGPKTESTVSRLVDMFNMVGNPAISPVMLLDGTAEVGREVEKGWIYQSGIRAELKFHPSVQRQVLFK
jgi:hypothetical protein